MNRKIKVERILFATDFLESSRLALDYAVAFASHFKASIILLHVVELSQAAQEIEIRTAAPSVSRNSAIQRLNALAKGILRLGLNVESHVDDGIPSEVIVSAVERYSADLLVLGIHGVHRGVEHLLIGSNTEKILLSSSCPTLTVGAHVFCGVDLQLHVNEILYFSDSTPESTAAAPYAVFFAKEFNASIDVCQLLPAASATDLSFQNQHSQNAVENNNFDKMTEALGNNGTTWSKSEYHLERGREFDQVIDRAQHENSGLIVLGVRKESHLGRHLHTSFAYQLLSKATCPVLSIRHDSRP
jgi:nucleotide-binding universal stress UspA family protein